MILLQAGGSRKPPLHIDTVRLVVGGEARLTLALAATQRCMTHR